MADNLKNKMLGTLAWISVDRFGQQLVQFVINIALARLLSPSEYTLIALVMIFVTISNTLVDGGFGYALIRKQDADETDFNSVFYFNIAVSLLLYVVLFFLAPPIAAFYNQPDLVFVGRIVFIAIFVNALYLIPSIKLIRALDFKKSATVNIISVSLSGITGIGLALKDMGVWALVAQQVSFPFFRVVIISFFVHWKPKLIFSIRVIKEFFGYSINLLGTSILNNIFNSLNLFVIGKFFPPQEVGIYYQANKINEASNFSFQAILGSSYNIFVKIQDDTERFRRVFRELVLRSSVIIFPLLLLLIAIADPLIHLLFSEKWRGVAPYLQMLCIASLFNPLYALIISALNARGKSRSTFNIELIKKILIVISIAVCLRFGIIALLVGFTIANYISTLITVFELKKEIGHFWRHQLSDILPSVLIGLVIAVVSIILMQIIKNQFFLLVVQLFVALIVYVVLVRVIYPKMVESALSFSIQKFLSWKKRK